MRCSAFLVLIASVALADPPQLKGTLKEKLDAGGYSYLRIATAAGEKWAAVPQVALKAGDAVTVDVQAEMPDFESKTLKRTWKTITFGTLAGAPPDAPSSAKGDVKPPTKAGVENPHASGLPTTPPAFPTVEGTVLETLEAATYTYLRLKTKDGDLWAAVPKASVAKGASVRIKNAQPMDGFKSPSLNRTFEKIVFGTLQAP